MYFRINFKKCVIFLMNICCYKVVFVFLVYFDLVYYVNKIWLYVNGMKFNFGGFCNV